MEFSTKAEAPEKCKSDCIVVAVYEGRQLSPAARRIDAASKGSLTAIVGQGDMEGRAASTTLLHRLPGIASPRVLLLGLGKAGEFNGKGFREAVRAALRAIGETGATDATLYLGDVRMSDRDAAWAALQTAMIAEDLAYRFDQMKSKAEPPRRLRKVTLAGLEEGGDAAAMARGAALAAGVSLARDLGNLPSNVCTPSYLAKKAQELAKRHRFRCDVLDERSMEKLGMGALLAVTKGTREPARFIVLEHRGGGRKDKPVVLVGKGITFDTGGISIKPSAEMDEMKYDMSGAGSVLGTFEAIARMKLPANVVGLIPTCENMPGGNAIKPGDVVTSMSGQTIEILNTDAEGRLILCDALTYAERFDPDAVIDIATLTGACVVALGNVATGLYSNDDRLAEQLLGAGEYVGDRGWRMPLWDEYNEQIKSPFADVANVGGRPAGSVTAACFLARFARKYKWSHLDIAGTAWRSGKDKGSTGRPVPMLTAFLMQRASINGAAKLSAAGKTAGASRTARKRAAKR